MPILERQDFQAALPKTGAILGVDPGEKRIGLAVSDVTRRIASPFSVIPRAKTFAATAHALWAAADARACIGVVIGLPLSLDGAPGPAAQAARAFARNLAAQRELPILLWDERLSSAAANRLLIAADASRKRRAEVVDKVAAAYLLQAALDAMTTASS